MKNPWLSYSLIRLALFFGPFLVLLLLNFNPFFSAIIAAAVSFAVSLVFLDKQRTAMSERVAQKLARGEAGTYLDEEASVEDAIIDSQAEVHKDDSQTDEAGKA